MLWLLLSLAALLLLYRRVRRRSIEESAHPSVASDDAVSASEHAGSALASGDVATAVAPCDSVASDLTGLALSPNDAGVVSRGLTAPDLAGAEVTPDDRQPQGGRFNSQITDAVVVDSSAPSAPVSMVSVTVNGVSVRLRVDQWMPSGGSRQWGLLLETMGTSISRDDIQRVLAAFCGGKPLTVLSTRFQEPSFSAARRVKGEIEKGMRAGEPRPCFNPNEDNINFQDNDQAARDDRWLLLWQHMTRQAKASGGHVLQLLDKSRGLSTMQSAEADFAADIGVDVVQEPLLALTPGGSGAANSGDSTALAGATSEPSASAVVTSGVPANVTSGISTAPDLTGVDGDACTFWFVRVECLHLQEAASGLGSLPAMQDLLRLHPDWMVQKTIVLLDGLCGVYSREYLFVSHRWETPDTPDPTGAQQRKVLDHLRQNPHIRFAWFE